MRCTDAGGSLPVDLVGIKPAHFFTIKGDLLSPQIEFPAVGELLSEHDVVG